VLADDVLMLLPNAQLVIDRRRGRRVLAAIQGNVPAMHEFTAVIAGTLEPAEFFEPEHLDRLPRTG
jgi:hypothetical protein